MLDKVNAEELPTQITAISGVQESSLSAMINNALLGNVNSNSPDNEGEEEYQVIHSYQNSHSQLSAMINNALLGNVNSNSPDSTITGNEGEEEYQVIHSYQNSHSQLSAMINNALLGNVNSNSPDSNPSEYVIEQFITIKPDGYNDNIIFEPKKKVELLNSNVPFILPVPFP